MRSRWTKGRKVAAKGAKVPAAGKSPALKLTAAEKFARKERGLRAGTEGDHVAKVFRHRRQSGGDERRPRLGRYAALST